MGRYGKGRNLDETKIFVFLFSIPFQITNLGPISQTTRLTVLPKSVLFQSAFCLEGGRKLKNDGKWHHVRLEFQSRSLQYPVSEFILLVLIFYL